MAGSAAIRSGGERTYLERLRPYLRPSAEVREVGGIPIASIRKRTAALEANAFYFSHPVWTSDWLQHVHKYPALRERWHAVAGSWNGKVIVDVGCGPGNLFANLGGNPAMLIGVDVALGSLETAAQVGYLPLLADAQEMPLRSGFADIVAMNATLHHCDDMRRALLESARLVKLGGVLVVDHDPQRSAWNFRGPGLLLWKLRQPLRRWMRPRASAEVAMEQQYAQATQVHHSPGDGLTENLLCSTLDPLGFETHIYPHNHQVGREVLQGHMGRSRWAMRILQRLSGIHPRSRDGALSLLCVARRVC